MSIGTGDGKDRGKEDDESSEEEEEEEDPMGNMGCHVFKGGYKINYIFGQKSTYSKEIINLALRILLLLTKYNNFL